MYVYIGVLFVIFILYLILYKFKYTKYSKMIFCISIFIIFTILQGFRAGNVGSDTSKYIKYYLMSENISFQDVLSKNTLNFEVGFGLLMKVLTILHCPHQGFLFIVAAFINGRNDVFHI